MKFRQTQRIQDAVHGLMEFVGPEALVVDALSTPEMQRLRRIRQLSLVHLVFPAAEHSRLVHSLGSAFLALRFGHHLRSVTRSQFGDALVPGDESIRDLGLAALTHDLGHGPLSHTWEREVMTSAFDRGAWIEGLGLHEQRALLETAKWHEIVTQGLLRWPEGSLNRLLEQHESGFSGRIADLLLGNYYIPYLPKLLASDIDVDRADFLKRDAAMSGAEYRYDLSWLISTCQVAQDEHGRLLVGFDERKGLSVVRHFLVSRRALYDTVYFHKTVRAAEGMVGLFLRRFKEQHAASQIGSESPFITSLLRILEGEVLTPQELVYLDDYGLAVLISETARDESLDFTLRDLAQRIAARSLFAEVPVDRQRLQEFLDRPEGFERIYQAVQPHVEGDPKFYVYPDRISFEWFESKIKHRGYLIDGQGVALPIRHHAAFQGVPDSESYLRLFTVSNAVESVRLIIGA